MGALFISIGNAEGL